MGFPILGLLSIAVTSFWLKKSERAQMTVLLMVSVSAIYIVVFDNIPLVGYLTRFDFFSLRMYALLVLVTWIHQFVDRADKKVPDYPLRVLYIRAVELFGRIVMLPSIVGYYIAQFPRSLSKSSESILVTMSVIVTGTAIVREYPGWMKAYNIAFARLKEKVLNPQNLKISVTERYAYNLHYHRKFSSTLTNTAESAMQTKNSGGATNLDSIGTSSLHKQRSDVSIMMVEVGTVSDIGKGAESNWGHRRRDSE